MKTTIKIKKNKNLSRADKDLINKNRAREFGKEEIKDFKKDYEPNTEWFFVKSGNKVVSFGGLRPIKIKYMGKTYNIKGICSTISLKKKKGYGRFLIQSMIEYLKKSGKTGLGFTGKWRFFKKAGLGTKKDFINRFVYINPKTGEKIIDRDGYGIYYEGKDKFISKVLKNKSVVHINVLHW